MPSLNFYLDNLDDLLSFIGVNQFKAVVFSQAYSFTANTESPYYSGGSGTTDLTGFELSGGNFPAGGFNVALTRSLESVGINIGLGFRAYR